MLDLIIAEASLELVPKQLRNHRSVISHARKLDKKASEILLDNSWHFSAMKGMQDELKRGRPDLVHLCLLEATGTILYRKDLLRIHIHTINDNVISISPGVRLPRSYHRFAGLIEKLLTSGSTTDQDGHILLKAYPATFAELTDDLSCKKTVGLSTLGRQGTAQEAAAALADSCLIVGGFQKGNFSQAVSDRITELYSIADLPLEAHIACGRVLYEYEKTVFM